MRNTAIERSAAKPRSRKSCQSRRAQRVAGRADERPVLLSNDRALTDGCRIVSAPRWSHDRVMIRSSFGRREFIRLSAAALGTCAVGFAVDRPKNAGIRLIVRGDDMGFSHSGNDALIKCFRAGIETSIEVLAPSPWFPEA